MELSTFISDAFSNELQVNILVGGKFYAVKAPTAKQYIKILGILGVGLLDEIVDKFNAEPDKIASILKILTAKDFSKDDPEELKTAFSEIIHLAQASDYFNQVPKRKKAKESKIIGGKTISGQITSFMEDLGMSLNEVLNTSYPLLLIMQHDKVRIDYDSKDEIKEISGKEMLKRKRG